MGTYISIPYVSRKVVHLEPVKPIAVDLENTITVIEAEKQPLAPIVEEVKEELKEEPKEALMVEVKEELPQNEVVNFPPLNMKIMIPVETTQEIVPEPTTGPVARIPEFIPNMNSESHAVKKFNRRHRKRSD